MSVTHHSPRPLALVIAVACLIAGAACQGPIARRLDARRQSPATTAPIGAASPSTATTPAATASPSAPVTPTPAPASPSGQAVRTDDLDAGLGQVDGQLSQAGSAVANADQSPQQSND
jgi:hypothetical protein